MAKKEHVSKMIWNEFVYGGHLLSLGAVSIVSVFAILVGIDAGCDYLLIVYLSNQIAYLYDRYKEYKIDFLTNPERTRHIKKYIRSIPSLVIIYAFVVFAIMVFSQKFTALLFWIFIIFLGLLYSKIFKGITKKIIIFKNLFVSVEWVLLVLLTIFYYQFPLNIPVLLILFFVFSRLLIHECFSDVKDIESDKKESLLTLPIIIGKEKLINVLSVINIFAIIPIILGVYLHFLPIYSLMLLFTLPYTVYYLEMARNAGYNKNFLHNVMVDGEFILWSVFILLGKIYYVGIIFN